MKQLFKKIIKVYQVFLSPLAGSQCRFYPSCSDYAIDAIEKHGIIKGCSKAFFRILRCNPFSVGGYDG